MKNKQVKPMISKLTLTAQIGRLTSSQGQYRTTFCTKSCKQDFHLTHR